MDIISISEYIKSIPYGSERTLVVCNEADETEQVAKHFEEKNIPYELVKEIESSCKILDVLTTRTQNKKFTENGVHFDL